MYRAVSKNEHYIIEETFFKFNLNVTLPVRDLMFHSSPVMYTFENKIYFMIS